MGNIYSDNDLQLSKPELLNGTIYTQQNPYPCGGYKDKPNFPVKNFPKIININSSFDLTREQQQYIESLFFKMPLDIEKDSIHYMAYKTPVFLIDDCYFEKIQDKTDDLGYYTRSKIHIFDNNPQIFICPEILRKINSIDFSLLFSKVLVHEYAHSLMDKDNFKPAKGDYNYYRWFEEAFANCITLKFFKVFEEDKNFNKVEKFILSQPDEYKFGYYLFEVGLYDYWKHWRDNKSKYCSLNQEAKNEWLKFAKQIVVNKNIINLKKAFEDFVKKNGL